MIRHEELLEHIHSPADVERAGSGRLPELCSEVRAFLINCVSKTGGHLASNFGTVELTIALHRVFDSPGDQIVWDVGHQCYTHKLLTGRRMDSPALRHAGTRLRVPSPRGKRTRHSLSPAMAIPHSPLPSAWPRRRSFGMSRARSLPSWETALLPAA